MAKQLTAESIREDLPSFVLFLRTLAAAKPEMVEAATVEYLDFASRNQIALNSLMEWLTAGAQAINQQQLHLAQRR
jgi:hypothetical protein